MNQYTGITQENRFWSYVSITADDNLCWIWNGSTNEYGYGRCWWDGKLIKAHRIAWMYPNYVIPNKMQILHSCDNPACCNPKHLYIGTHEDNMSDKMAKGRQKKSGKQNLILEQVNQIRKRYQEGNVTQVDLANEYKVLPMTINNIINFRTWKK